MGICHRKTTGNSLQSKHSGLETDKSMLFCCLKTSLLPEKQEFRFLEVQMTQTFSRFSSSTTIARPISVNSILVFRLAWFCSISREKIFYQMSKLPLLRNSCRKVLTMIRLRLIFWRLVAHTKETRTAIPISWWVSSTSKAPMRLDSTLIRFALAKKAMSKVTCTRVSRIRAQIVACVTRISQARSKLWVSHRS